VSLVGLGLFLLSRSPAPSSPQPTAAPSSPPPTMPAATAQVNPPAGPYVARINQHALTQADLTLAYAVDHALSALLGHPEPSSAEVLERLVNLTLISQAAESAGTPLSSLLDETETLTQVAATYPFEPEDLAGLLAHYDVAPDAFLDYYRRLRAADRFIQQTGQEVTAYVGALRAESDIELAASAHLPDLTPLPQPTLATPQPTLATPQPTLATPQPIAQRGTSEGDYAPDFELSTLSGAPERLTWEDLRGAPTVLSFWVTWCSHCRAQTPQLIAGHERYAQQGVQFVGVNIKEAEDQVRAYVEKAHIPYPVVLDSDGTVAARYSVRGFPTTYFLDAEGRVVARHVGQLREGDIDRYLTARQGRSKKISLPKTESFPREKLQVWEVLISGTTQER
jgi:peroxiredoxin